MSDSNRKLFLTSNNVGIATYGQADIQGVPIAGFIDSFISSLPENQHAHQVAEALLIHFRGRTPIPNTCFHVAGYSDTTPPNQEVWIVDTQANTVIIGNQPNQQGMAYGGEGDIITRLFQQVAVSAPNNTWSPLPNFQVPINFFTIQDSIDFAAYIIRTTIDTMRFQSRAKTVGGPIDVLVIYPSHSQWVKQKNLQLL